MNCPEDRFGRDERGAMTAVSYYFRIPLLDAELCFSYSEENTRRIFAVDDYPDGTTQILVGKLRARMSPEQQADRRTELIFH